MNQSSGPVNFLVEGDNRYRELRYNLLQSTSWITNLSRQLLKPFDITPKQYSILYNLAVRFPESLSIQDVRNSLADQMSDASRLIDRLERKGLLEKFPSDQDRRSNRVRIATKGMDLLRQINTQWERFDRVIRDRLSKEEVTSLNNLLGRLK